MLLSQGSDGAMPFIEQISELRTSLVISRIADVNSDICKPFEDSKNSLRTDLSILKVESRILFSQSRRKEGP